MGDDKKPKAADEKKQAASSYIILLYNNVVSVTSNYALYMDLILQLQYKYKNVDIEKMSDEEKQLIFSRVGEIRYAAQMAYIAIDTIQEKIPDIHTAAEKEKFKSLYLKVRDNLIINRDDLLDFVMSANRFLTSKVMKEILENSHDYLNQIYGGADYGQPGQ